MQSQVFLFASFAQRQEGYVEVAYRSCCGLDVHRDSNAPSGELPANTGELMVSFRRMSDTAAVRAGEGLDTEALASYLRGKLEDGEHLAVEQFPGGHSDLTYLLRTPVREYGLRRGPRGPVAPRAHDMAREYRILKAVHAVFPAAPEVFLLCEDTSIVGAVFFVMERRRGIVVRDSIPPELGAFPEHSAHIMR